MGIYFEAALQLHNVFSLEPETHCGAVVSHFRLLFALIVTVGVLGSAFVGMRWRRRSSCLLCVTQRFQVGAMRQSPRLIPDLIDFVRRFALRCVASLLPRSTPLALFSFLIELAVS